MQEKKECTEDYETKIFQNYHYMYALLNANPSQRLLYEEKFTTLLYEWGIYLDKIGCINELVQYYKSSIDIFPNNTRILNNFAAHLLNNKKPLEAITYLERALESDTKNLSASRNLQNACSMSVERWHFTMLNDKSRNQAFDKAIRKKILQGYDTVLDIGTGTGLLSLYSHNSKAKKIYACEHSPVMCKIAKQIFQRNNVNNIKLICKASTHLEVPQDIPERVKLIVAEIFDAALFGELVIPTLIDAHEKLLLPDGKGIILPMSASLYVAVVECEYIRSRFSVLFSQSQHLGSLNFKNTLLLPDENYYDTENLENVHINYVTEPKSILQINFNKINELRNFNQDGIKSRMSTNCRYNGVIDGLVVWFQLKLDEEITLDSSQGESCWQLAVYPICPQNVRSNDKIMITAEICNGILKCSCNTDCSNLNVNENLTFYLPRDVITFLNDKKYITALIQQAQARKDKLISSVFDTSPFPIYGLILMKENVNCQILYYQTDNEELQRLIHHIINQNSIEGEVRFICDPEDIDSTVGSIYIHSFDTKGELLDWGEQSYKQIFSHLLTSNDNLLPHKIDLLGQLVYSEELTKIVSVNDDNLQSLEHSPDSIEHSSSPVNCKYIVAEYINKFKINQVFDLNSNLCNYINISEPVQLTTMDGSETKETIVNFGKIDIKKNVIPNALVCWYKIFLDNNDGYETKRNDSFMNYMAVVFEKELKDKIENGTDVKIKVEQMYDILRINIV